MFAEVRGMIRINFSEKHFPTMSGEQNQMIQILARDAIDPVEELRG